MQKWKEYNQLRLILLALIGLSLILWYSSFAYAVFVLLDRFKLPFFDQLAYIGRFKFVIMRLFHYLATVDNSTVTTLIFPLVLINIYLNFKSLIKGKLKTIDRYPTSKYYQIITTKDSKNPKKLLPIHFPLFHSYRVTFLQLGLIGTLFAMTIAFQETSKLKTEPQKFDKILYEQPKDSSNTKNDPGIIDSTKNNNTKNKVEIVAKDTSTFSQSEKDSVIIEDARKTAKEIEERMSRTTGGSQILLSALGTALWSSLMAIFVAFIVGPFIIEKAGITIVKRKFLNEVADAKLPDPIEIGQKFHDLKEKVNLSEQGFSNLINIIGTATPEFEKNNEDEYQNQKYGQSLIDKFNFLNEGLSKMNENLDNVNNFVTIKENTNRINRLENDIIPNFKERMSELTYEFSSKCNTIFEKIDNLSQNVENSIQIHNQDFNNLRTEIKQNIESESKKIHENILKLKEEMENRINKLSEIFNDQFMLYKKESDNVQKQHFSTLDEEIKKEVENLRKNITSDFSIYKKENIKNYADLTKNLKDQYTSFKDEIKNKIETFSKLFTDKFNELQRSTKNTINDFNKSFDKKISDYKLETEQKLDDNMNKKIITFRAEMKKLFDTLFS